MNPVFLRKLFELYLLEDAFFGDLTTEAISSEKIAKASVIAKEDFILAGVVFLKPLFETFGEDFKLKIFRNDGDALKIGDKIASVESNEKTLLYVERVCLNLLQRLSGIATKTHDFCKLLQPYDTKIVDTRKTTPGMRYFEKYAVRVGGGVNHRFGLFDAVLIKDNHIKVAGGIKKAVELVRNKIPFTTKIEIECANFDMVEEAINCGADIVMLDNMDLEQIDKVMSVFKGKTLFEVSGNVTEKNLIQIAQTGVDYISSGALVHHACWVDMNMKLE